MTEASKKGVDMIFDFPGANRMRLASMVLLGSTTLGLAFAQTPSPSDLPATANCRVEAIDYKGWRAEQLSNRWLQLIVVPQNGGRLMQVSFAGHSYLFVNPKFAGKYLPPTPVSGSTTEVTSCGSCRRETATKNIGWAILICWTMGLSAFEKFRKENSVRSNSPDRPILRPASRFNEAFTSTPSPRASLFMHP